VGNSDLADTHSLTDDLSLIFDLHGVKVGLFRIPELGLVDLELVITAVRLPYKKLSVEQTHVRPTVRFYGDGIGSFVGSIFGGCPNTTYGESVGCVAITKNASVYTIITAAILSMLIAFISPFIAFVNSIPSCVMGGVCMALYGFIAVSGLKMIQNVDLNQNKNLFVVSSILIAGIGGLTLTFGKITLTSVACALILGIIINLVVSKAKEQ
jgi:xanthine/uracil permease